MNWIVLFIAGVFEVAMTFLFGEDQGSPGCGALSLDRRVRPGDGSVYRSIIGKNIL